MAVTTSKGVTTLKPTAWKWFVGAGAVFFLWPGFGFLIALFFVLMGTGALQNVTLSPDGVKVRNWFSTKSYAWHEVQDFKVYKVRSGLITAASMVSFSHVDKQRSVMGKAAKFLVGGTHSIPAIGMPAQKLAQLMQAYKLGFVPKDNAVPERAPTTPVPAFPAPASPQSARTTRASPELDGAPIPLSTPKKRPPKQAKLARSSKTSTPMVQEGGGWFGRRPSDSRFGS